jgi:ketosteroid isomerase-like protein
MSAAANRKLLLDVFRAIEQRDDKRFRELLHPDFELHWPSSLPYGGSKGVVLWRQRGVSPSGERFEGEVLGLYQLRDGKLARAQMFYFDTVAVANFLKKATSG